MPPLPSFRLSNGVYLLLVDKDIIIDEMTNSNIPDSELSDRARQAYDYLMSLSDITVRFTEIERAPRHPDGSRENDVEHSYHLALIATELASLYYPDLNSGLVTQFSLVHDLPEVYSGDVRTYEISASDAQKKMIAEKQATDRLLGELPPHTAQLLQRYEDQSESEARFVRLVDKFLPPVINMLAGDASTFVQDFDIQDKQALEVNRITQKAKLRQMFPEFEFLHAIIELVLDTSSDHVFRK